MKKQITGRLAAAFFLSFCIVITSNSFSYGYALASDNKSLNDNLTSYEEEIQRLEIFKDRDNLLTSEELQRLRNTSYKPCTYEYLGSVDDLYNNIIMNSNNYLQDRDYSSILEIREDYIREYILKIIKDVIKRNLKEERKDNIHKLISLRIVVGSLEEDTLGEYKSSENLIILDIDKVFKKSNTIDDIYMNIYDCLNHEFNHVFQGSCGDKVYNQTSFILESSAESYNYNILKNDYKPVDKRYNYGYTYLEERKYESKLFLMSLLDNDKPIEEYYDAIDKGDLKELFNFLDLESLKDKNDLLEGLYLVDGILLRNDYWSRVINSKDFKDLGDYNINELLHQESKGDFESYVLKMSIKNLMKYNILKKDLSLKDNLTLYHFILINTLDTASFNDYNYLTYEVREIFYKEFYENYMQIEEIFFRFLASLYNYSEEEIRSIDDSLDKETIVNGINDYFKTGYCSKENIYLKELVDKYPKIRVVLRSGIVLTNFNYKNIKSLKDKEYPKEGIKLILK